MKLIPLFEKKIQVWRSSDPTHPDIGYHFGTQKAAADRMENLEREDGIKKYNITLDNPIRLRDVGAWADFKDVADELLKNEIIDKGEYEEAEKHAKTQGIWGDEHKILRKILVEKGYDGILYKNESEDQGKDSYIVFDKSQIELIPE